MPYQSPKYTGLLGDIQYDTYFLGVAIVLRYNNTYSQNQVPLIYEDDIRITNIPTSQKKNYKVPSCRDICSYKCMINILIPEKK